MLSLLARAGLVSACLLMLTLEAWALTASWYQSGSRTANGERFHPDGMTCAHRTLRFGTRVRVTDLKTGRSVVCRVTDRGPAKWTGHAIDLSRGAAKALGIIRRGTARVSIQPVR